ncbi:hypothetical protein [Candidatus Endomicrobiellum agilis]|uniref:hypothetical protein n=1 Tax=Candidatus Endomicrobiellum agilis TaxID=3238957 RepID=UPI0035777426|nr:hypothetical protein [Endomicrobium sp.]
MIPKLTLVLCDTCVIIKAFRTNSWKLLIKEHNIVISEIIKKETKYYKVSGKEQKIDLSNCDNARCISQTSSDLSAFRVAFNYFNIDKLDDGETELLSYLYNNKDTQNIQICSEDAVVFKILGRRLESNLCVSLEELLPKNKKLLRQFTKKFKIKELQKGLMESKELQKI